MKKLKTVENNAIFNVNDFLSVLGFGSVSSVLVGSTAGMQDGKRWKYMEWMWNCGSKTDFNYVVFCRQLVQTFT